MVHGLFDDSSGFHIFLFQQPYNNEPCSSDFHPREAMVSIPELEMLDKGSELAVLLHLRDACLRVSLAVKRHHDHGNSYKGRRTFNWGWPTVSEV